VLANTLTATEQAVALHRALSNTSSAPMPPT
jgi:hypothetical protein